VCTEGGQRGWTVPVVLAVLGTQWAETSMTGPRVGIVVPSA